MLNRADFLRITVLAALCFAVLSMHVVKGNAQEGALTPGDAIERLFAETTISPEWFTPDFLAVAPAQRIESIVRGLTSDFGAFVRVDLEDRQGIIRLETARVPTEVTLDEAGRIAGLFFHPPEPLTANPEETAAAILNVSPGKPALLVTIQNEDGTWSRPVSHNAAAAMAVGSAFKLAVLRAYEDAVAAGRLSRSDVVALQAEDLSLPSGVLQTMRPGTPITLETLAGLMIQHSDNTATDALVRILGADAVEALSPRNAPLLTTAALFKLIAAGNDTYRSRFAEGDAASRQELLTEIEALPLPDAATIGNRATWPEAEWFFTAEDLCDLLISLRDAPSLNGEPNPLVADDGWSWIGFKGGSEFGVLNLSASGITPAGRKVCASVTINAGEAVPEERIALLFGTLFRSLATLD